MKTIWLGAAAIIAFSAASSGQASAIETVLHSFTNGPDGGIPTAGMIFDKVGNLYGTAYAGGTILANGVVYKMSPPAVGKSAWTEMVLYRFKGVDGAHPIGGLVFDTSGNLYGTPGYGGNPLPNAGTVFKLTPPAPGKTAWTESVLHRFGSGADGRGPWSSLTIDADGNFLGTTSAGGKSNHGTVFKMMRPAVGQTAWTETVRYSFTGASGNGPIAGVIFDVSGNLYGTTSTGGAANMGTFFKLIPQHGAQFAISQKESQRG